MGDTLFASGAVTATATWEATDPDDSVRLIVNGTVATTMAAGDASTQTWELDPASVRWFTLEVRRGETLRAISNPIFLSRK